MNKRLLALFLTGLLALSAGSALAKITPVCENNGGNQPSGQQPSCQGAGLTQENQNPAGHAPPGHNP
jgi:hypothetical protein